MKNKYYSSKVELHFKKLKDFDKTSVASIGATIWSTKECSDNDLESLDAWQEKLADHDIEVQLIVVNRFNSEDSKTKVTEWAIKSGVEIIDFSEDEINEEEHEENVGIFASSSQKRIVEALQTVMWTQFSSASEENGQESTTTEREMDDFETLFANLVHFKETATGLPDEERRKFAEKVALSFYSALGEDEDSD